MSECPFCDHVGPWLAEYYDDVIIFEPLNPVTPGHVLAVPLRHVEDATTDSLVTARVMQCAVYYARENKLAPCNFITSVGAEATQSVFHLHLHIVPRRQGDGLALPWAP